MNSLFFFFLFVSYLITEIDSKTQLSRKEIEIEIERIKRGAEQPFFLFGIKAKGRTMKIVENRLTIGIKEETKILLLGKDLDKTKVMITSVSALKGTICNPNESEDIYSLKKLKPNIYEFQITENHLHVHYFCLYSPSNQWIHQGNNLWVSYEVTGPMFPLHIRIAFIILLLLLSALFSGLTLGLMALDKNELKVLARCGNDRDRKDAKVLQPLRENGNFLLCSLIIGNVIVNAAQAVLWKDLTNGVVSAIISTLTIVIIAEILPQAICSRYGLYFGAKTIYITYLTMIITSPVSYPLSKLLDWILGAEIGRFYDRECLQEYIRLTKDETRLEDDEINVIEGAFEFDRKTVAKAMTPLDQVYMIPIHEKLDAEIVFQITQNNFSRIPVYEKERSNIVGILYVKDLLLYTSSVGDAIPIETIVKSSVNNPNYLITVTEDIQLKILLDEFKQGKCHMALVKQKNGDKIIGVVTMEDVLEEIFQEAIIDETDIIVDRQKRLTRKGVQKNVSEIFKIGEARTASYFELSPQLLDAIYLFLSTTLKPFTSKYLSESILRKLITQKIYHEVKVDNNRFQGKPLDSAVFTNGVAADYFLLLIEGKMMLTFGKDPRSFECKQFAYFGVSALSMSDDEFNRLKQSFSLTSNPNKPFSNKYFKPDFTVNIVSDCLYLKLTRTLYLTACRANITDQTSTHETAHKTPKQSVAKKLDKLHKGVTMKKTL